MGRAGMLNILLCDDWNWAQVASLSVVHEIRGDVHETFERLDASNDGKLDIDELEAVFKALGADVSQHSMTELMSKLDVNGDGYLDREEFTVWYYASEERILGAMRAIFDETDVDDSGHLCVDEIYTFLHAIDADNVSRAEVTRIMGKHGDGTVQDNKRSGQSASLIAPSMTFEQFRKWFVTTPAYRSKLSAFTEQAEDLKGHENFSVMSVPSSLKGRVWFVLVMPLILIFMMTIPDTRRAGKESGAGSHLRSPSRGSEYFPFCWWDGPPSSATRCT